MRPFLEQVGSRWIVNDGRKRLPGYHRSRNEALAAMRELREPLGNIVEIAQENAHNTKPTRTRARAKG